MVQEFKAPAFKGGKQNQAEKIDEMMEFLKQGGSLGLELEKTFAELPKKYSAPGLMPCISTVAPKSAEEFLLERLSKQDPASVGHNVFALKYFFKEIIKQELDIPNPKRNKILPDILSIKEIKKMIDCTKNIKHKLIIKLLYGTGLRASEIINLKQKNFDFEENLIKIQLAKGKKDRFVKYLPQLKKICSFI